VCFFAILQCESENFTPLICSKIIFQRLKNFQRYFTRIFNVQIYAKPQRFIQQDHQALLKAKYCPQVGAALCTQKNTKKTRALVHIYCLLSLLFCCMFSLFDWLMIVRLRFADWSSLFISGSMYGDRDSIQQCRCPECFTHCHRSRHHSQLVCCLQTFTF